MDTVSVMRQLARMRAKDPEVRSFALSILRQYGIDSHNFASECGAIGDFVKRHVRYVRDAENVEQLQDPKLMIEDIRYGRAQGDCDDMSLLIATLLLCIGAAPYFRTVRYQNMFGPYNHIYVVCYENDYREPKQRIVLDAIAKDKMIGYEFPHKSGDEHKV